MAVTLADILAEMRANRRTVTVYSATPHPELEARFEGWNVELRFDRLPPGTDEEFVTVRGDGEFLGSVDAEALAAFFEPTLPAGVGSASDERLAAFLDLLDDTLFRSDERRRLLAASREFEDRAWRIGTGTIHAGFQRPAALSAQRSVYETLAERGLDVHLYLDGEWDEDLAGATAHTTAEGELGEFWFVAFDGGGDASQACALLAEERDPGSYTGFWTYDPDRVAELIEHLEATYH